MSARIHVEELPTDKPRTRVLKVQVTEEALQKGLRQVARAISRQIQIPGFRPGRAPYELVERRVGRITLIREFLERHFDELLREALEQVDISPAYPVEVLRIELDPLFFEVEVPLAPVVDLDNYLEVRVPYEEPEVTDEEVERFIRSEILAHRGTWETVEDAVQFGDRVEAIVTIKVGSEEVESDQALSAELEEGLEYYLPGLVEELPGMRPGEEKTLTLPVPESHPWRAHGEEAEVTVKIREVKRRRVPELTPELVKELEPEASDPEEFRQIIRERLEQGYRERYRKEYLDKVFQVLRERGVTVEYPPLVLDRLVDEYVEDLKRYAQRMGLSYEEFLRAAEKTEEELRQEARESYAENLWRTFVLSEIIEQQQLAPRENDLVDAAAGYIWRYNLSQDQFARLMKDTSFQEDLVQEALRRRAEDVLIAIARGEWQQATSEEAAGTDEETEEASEGAEPSSPATDEEMTDMTAELTAAPTTEVQEIKEAKEA